MVVIYDSMCIDILNNVNTVEMQGAEVVLNYSISAVILFNVFLFFQISCGRELYPFKQI